MRERGVRGTSRLRSNTNSSEVRRGREVVSADLFLRMVARHLRCTKKDLLLAQLGLGADNRGRGIAMKLCQEMGSMKLSDMGELFGVGSGSAVSRSVS